MLYEKPWLGYVKIVVVTQTVALSRQTAALCDGGDNSNGNDDKIDTGPSSTPYLIESLIDFMQAKLLPSVFAQQLNAMHPTVVNLNSHESKCRFPTISARLKRLTRCLKV